MELIQDIKDIKENMAQLDKYFDSKKDPENGFAMEIIRKGVCFVALRAQDGYKFYPSRFIGYKNNDMDHYLANELKQGQQVNPILTEVLGNKPIVNADLEKEYKKFCVRLGFVARNRGAFGVERKYWVINEEQ